MQLPENYDPNFLYPEIEIGPNHPNAPSPELIARAKELNPQHKNGEPFTPTYRELEWFQEIWCEQCQHKESALKHCEILSAALLGEQPEEWMYWENIPLCKGFTQHDAE